MRIDPIKFCELLRLETGKRMQLLKWQREMILALCSGLYREAFLFVPRKNGKTALCAALALLFLVTMGPGQEIYIAAADRDQASIVYKFAAGMVRQDPTLRQLVQVLDYRREMVCGNSVLRSLSRESATKHGLNPSLVIADELHAWPDRELHDVLWTGQGARERPLFVSITTAGLSRDGLAYEKYDHCKRMESGLIPRDPAMYYQLFEGNDFTMDQVAAANPSMGMAVRQEYLETELAAALHDPNKRHRFAWAHLNMWVDAVTAWLDKTIVDAAEVAELPPVGEVYAIGLDLSSVLDMSGFVVTYQVGDTVYVRPHIYTTRYAAARYEERYGVPYRAWEAAGFITVFEGNAIDPVRIRQDMAEAYPAPARVVLDRWGGNETILDMQARGFPVETMGQGFASMSAPAKEFQRLVTIGKLRWSNPVMTWCARHVEIQHDPAGNIKPVKSAPMSHKKIDPIVACVMSLRGLTLEPELDEVPMF